jgi:outer membrane protein assembly factor BamB
LPKKPTSLVCPSCGAPLRVAENQNRVDCQYCYATIELPSDNLPPIIIQAARNQDFHYQKPVFSLIGLLTGVFVLFIIGIVAFVIISTISKTEIRSDTGLRIYSINNPILTKPELVDSPGEVLGIGYNEDETYRLTFLDFSKKPVVQWQSSDLGDQTYLIRFMQSDQKIVMVSKTSVSVLQKSSGTKIWETSLSDQLPNACESCVQITDTTIFALTQIGILHAIDLETGQQNWSINFDDWHDGIVVFDNNPIVVRDVDGVPTITTLDGSSGQIISESNPTCPNHIFTDDPQEFELNSTMVQDQNNYYLLYGFWEPGCLEKWDPVTSTRDWQTLLPENLPRVDQDFLFNEESLFLSSNNGNEIWKVNLLTGDAQEILNNEDYYIQAVIVQNDILIVEADRIKGSNRFELWGIDMNTNRRIWQYIPKAAVSMRANPSSIVDSSGFFTYNALTDQFVLLQAFDDPPILTFDLIDLKTGVSKSQTSYTLGEQTIFSLDIIGWQNQVVWLDIDNIIAFDSFTGQPLTQWP